MHVVLRAAVVLALAAPSGASLQYFGFYEADLAETASFSNLYQVGLSITAQCNPINMF